MFVFDRLKNQDYHYFAFINKISDYDIKRVTKDDKKTMMLRHEYYIPILNNHYKKISGSEESKIIPIIGDGSLWTSCGQHNFGKIHYKKNHQEALELEHIEIK